MKEYCLMIFIGLLTFSNARNCINRSYSTNGTPVNTNYLCAQSETSIPVSATYNRKGAENNYNQLQNASFPTQTSPPLSGIGQLPSSNPQENVQINVQQVPARFQETTPTVGTLDYQPINVPTTRRPQATQVQENLPVFLPTSRPEVVLHEISSESFHDFAWQLFIRAPKRDNIILSPIILHYQLSLLREFSAGATREELDRAVGDVRPQHISRLFQNLKTSTDLELANGIFYDRNLELKKSFRNFDPNFTKIEAHFFKEDPSGTITAINRWASDVTHGYIKTLLANGFPIQNVKMLLASAIYFKGNWKYRFNSTSPSTFYNANGESVLVPFMEIKNNILIDRANIRTNSENVALRIIQLPYDDEEHAMLIIVPEERKIRINDITSFLNPSRINRIMTSISENLPQRVTLKMPKFYAASGLSVVEALKQLGVQTLFTDQANLSGVGIQASVGDIVHQSILKVDETGTTAAAVAATFLIPLSADSVVNREYIIDRPFLSMIYNTKTRVPLFISQISKINGQ